MPRLSPFAGKRPERYMATQTVTSPDTGKEDTITLQYLDKPLAHLAVDIASKLVAQYVGFPDEGVPPKQYFTYLGGAVEMSESLCRSVGNLYVMQAAREDGGALYSADELIALSVTDEGFWDALEQFADEVNKTGRKLKNAQRVSGGAGSPTPSDINSPTPNSLNEQIASSEGYTNDWGRFANTLQEIEQVMT